MIICRAALLSALLATAAPVLAQPAATPLAGTVRRDGLLPVNVDAKNGRILVSLPAPDGEGVSGRFLHVVALKTGLGSAPIGLDRAMSGGSRIIAFRRMGKKVIAEVENPRFRATDAPASEQAAARESFATSTLWAGDVVGDAAGGGAIVDISGLLTRDIIGIVPALTGAGEQGYQLSADLSVADPASVKVFPDNIEMEARQTFVSATPGAEVNNIAPQRGNISFTLRHSLIRLPEPGYQPRRFDPRTGTFATQVLDFAAPLGSDIVYELANRFRLEKVDPTAARSPVKKPIIFYIDRSAPEPIRTALLEGTRWWSDAFDAAGYVGGFRAEILPEGVDPLDIRYNVVNWVNRATRGWSYGQAIDDPRTGEIIKGNVLLGSLRVRQDMLIFEGLAGADKVGTGGPNDPIQASLARIRQLAAHEVGHALGLAHNFAASSQERYSVMDYPAPRVKLTGGAIDLSDAYGVGLGRWDRFAVDWLYGAGSEEDARTRAAAGQVEGLRYIGDADARPVGSGNPVGAIWDDGADPAGELDRMMDVRRVALDGFGLPALRTGEPVSNLRRKFVPIWLMHRYQVEAASKLVGGVGFSYSVAGDGHEAAQPVDGPAQRRALASLVATLRPDALSVPAGLIPYLSAGWSGSSDRQYDIEIFRTAGGPVFDPLAASEAAAGVTLNALLAPERLNRLALQRQGGADLPGAGEAVETLLSTLFASGPEASAPVRRRVATTAVLALARVHRNPALASEIAMMIDGRLASLAASLDKRGGTQEERTWAHGLARLIRDRAALAEAAKDPARHPQIPPGMPIGSGEGEGY